MNAIMPSVTIMLLTIILAPAQGAETDAYRGKVFLGISGDSVELPPNDQYKSTFGLKLTRIASLSSGDLAGLNIGDIIVSLGGKPWTDDQIRLSRSFGIDKHKARPGDSLKAVVLRHNEDDPDAPPTLETLDLQLAPYPSTAEDDLPHNDLLRPDLAEQTPVYQTLCRQLIDKAGFTDDYQDLLQRIDHSSQFPDPHRLLIMRYVHRDAFKLEAITREIAEPYLADQVTITQVLAQIESVLITFDRRPPVPPVPPVPPAPVPPVRHESQSTIKPLTISFANSDLEGHLDYIQAVLAAAGDAHAKAFKSLSEDDRRFIVDHRQGMIDSFVEHKMLSYDDDPDRQANSVKLLALASKLNLKSLHTQAVLAEKLVNPSFAQSLQAAAIASGKDLTAEVVAERQTPHGLIRISGTARARHEKHFAALYDLGGDDNYANNQGASFPTFDETAIPTAVLVDYAGHDVYESTDSFSQGCGDMGVGMLVDLAGNDRYVGMRFSQGTGFLGIGILCDQAGDDTYRGIEIHQGVGHFGAGVLIDLAGKDRYEAHLASQGVGLPGGYGLLLDTGNEGDEYYCKGKQASGYGTPGVFEGWGQGVGIGYRPYASGGVGALIDTGGPDRIEGGNFSQGGGYFYGFGILYNHKGNDQYIGSRYAQGFTAHQAAGAFIDTQGDDLYQTRYAVAQGLSWDETVTLFIDQQGDDIYEGGSFSQGASAMNGIAIFLELAGNDTYLYTDQAKAGGNHYHGGTSLSFFIDAGGGQDNYPSKPNNQILTGKEHFIFVDLPQSLSRPLTKKIINNLMTPPADSSSNP